MFIQTVALEGNSFSHTLEFSYFRFGPTVRCDDIEVYQPTQKVYVACWGMTAPEQDAGIITILEINLRNSSDYREINLNQTEARRVQFRMRIGLYNLTQASGSSEPYLVLYDQGISSTEQFFNKWLRVLDNINNGFAKDAGYVDIGAGFPGSRTLHDIFGFNGYLLMTTSILGEATISMTQCAFNEGPMTVTCNNVTRKRTNIDYGYVGLTTNNQFVTYEYITNTLKTCYVTNNFNDPAWISSDCEVHTSMPRFDDCFIQLVEDNWHAKMITWVYPDGSYAGISAWSRELGRSFKEENVTGALINRHFYEVTTKEFLIRDWNYDALILKGSELPERGENPVVVTAKDDDNTATAQMIGTSMENAYD